MLIAGLQPFSLSDYPNHISAIIFTVGCDFRCPYCHNKNLWFADRYQDEELISEDKIFTFLQQKQGKIDGLVITGGEPTLQTNLKEFITKVKELNYAVKLDTNGYNPHILQNLIQENLLDFIAMDIKAPWQKYAQVAGIDVDIKKIQHSIEIIQNSSVKHLFRTTWDKSLLTEEDIVSIQNIIKNSKNPTKSTFVLQTCNTEVRK